MQQHKVWQMPETKSLDRSGATLYFFVKRVLDIIIVTSSLILLCPLMLLIALLIRLDSPGGAIFKQERVGAKRRRRPDGSYYWEQQNFTIYKFRTMCVDAKPQLHQEFMKAVIAGDETRVSRFQEIHDEKARSKMVKDPRITKVGAFLRKTSLDELPQLWNVLTGDMSLVGPRPPIPYEVELYKPWHLQRLNTVPGITGLWQISGRSSTSFDDMVRLDIQYISTQSLGLDLKIMFGTLPAVLFQRGAY